MGVPPSSGGFQVTVNNLNPGSISMLASDSNSSAPMLSGWGAGAAEVIARGHLRLGWAVCGTVAVVVVVARTRTSKETPRPVAEPLRRSLRLVMVTVRLLM